MNSVTVTRRSRHGKGGRQAKTCLYGGGVLWLGDMRGRRRNQIALREKWECQRLDSGSALRRSTLVVIGDMGVNVGS